MSDIISIDPQAYGFQDDGYESGRIRTYDSVGGLVKMPFREGQYSASVGPGCTVSHSGMTENSDGSGEGLFIFTVANPVAGPDNGFGYASIRFLVHGTAFGIRFLRNNQLGTALASIPFCVLIDAVPYLVDTGWNLLDIGDTFGPPNYDAEGGMLISNTLTDTTHQIELRFQNNFQDQTSTPSWTIYGYWASRAAGYSEYPRIGSLYTTLPVTTSNGSIPQSLTAASRMRGLRKMFYYNTTNADITVTLQWNNADFYNLVVPANGSAEFDPGIPLAMAWANIKHRASATGVNATIIGGL